MCYKIAKNVYLKKYEFKSKLLQNNSHSNYTIYNFVYQYIVIDMELVLTRRNVQVNKGIYPAINSEMIDNTIYMNYKINCN